MNNIYMHSFCSDQAVAIDKSLVAGAIDSNPAYVLQYFVYEGAKCDPSSKIAGSEYDVFIRLMEMAECFDNENYLFTGNIFITYAAAAYLLERGSFLTGTMCRSQLHHLPNEITPAKPKVGQKIFFLGKINSLSSCIDRKNLRINLL